MRDGVLCGYARGTDHRNDLRLNFTAFVSQLFEMARTGDEQLIQYLEAGAPPSESIAMLHLFSAEWNAT